MKSVLEKASSESNFQSKQKWDRARSQFISLARSGIHSDPRFGSRPVAQIESDPKWTISSSHSPFLGFILPRLVHIFDVFND